ncbi:sacsin [Gigaspora margarita]|uniref:Sacsin n=1 Tax=Gigaspora margarita TaxID=4874 RepID=A0A8H4EP07_GIGMA|nr:sacsin [Gigaspora margarita]
MLPTEVHPVIINLLHEQERLTVLMEDKNLEELEDLKPQKANPQFIRDILKNNKNNEFISNIQVKYHFVLLRYILEDKKYNDLENISLVPLFNNQFGKFDNSKTYYIASKEQFKLFFNAGLHYFIPIELLKSQKLLSNFINEVFRKVTNIKEFGEPTINSLLNQELNISSERDWNLSEPYSPFPLLEVYDPNDQHKHQLVSLKNAESRPLIYHNSASNSDIIQMLANLGIRFTKHQPDTKLSKYIYELGPS